MSWLKDIPQQLSDLWKFVTVDIWRITDAEVKGMRQTGYNFLKTILLAIRRYNEDQLQRKAAALTYSTLLSIVPMLAIMFAIAKGFGFNNILTSQLLNYFPGQKEILTQALTWVNSYMQQVQGGIFMGIGIVLLLWTVLNLVSNIENCFNEIWMVKKGRSYYRQVTDYFSLMLLAPVFIICSSGLSIFVSTTFSTLSQYHLITPFAAIFFKLAPFVVTIFMFTGIYIFLPNTKVRFKSAFYAGIFAGIAFQSFQYLYISGQIWVSKYNAIYGSFAALPLLLLWLQLSWVICLLGAELAYASQNIRAYEFEADSKNITRRYKDFLTISIMSVITKRFAAGERAVSANKISSDYKIPTRLTTRILIELMEMKFINEVIDEDNHEICYQPSIDIASITVGGILNKIDQSGSEFFKIDKDHALKNEWKTIVGSRSDMVMNNKNLLVKDI